MEKIIATIKSVSVYNNDKSSNVRITIDKTFKGYKQERDEQNRALGADNKVETDVDYFDINLSACTARLCELDDDIADFRSSQVPAFSQGQLGQMLRNAQIVIERVPYAAGEIIPDVVDKDGNPVAHKYDGYNTIIVGLTLTEKAKKRINDTLDKLMMSI